MEVENRKGEKLMTRINVARFAYFLTLSLAMLGTAVADESVKVEGFIKGRSGDTMTLKISGAPDVVVLLTSTTEVGQVQGLLQVRRKDMSMAALIPGLAVKVEGTYNDQHQLVAKLVSFKGNDLERAEAIEAGVHETKTQTQQNAEQLQKQQGQMGDNEDAAAARFRELDDYNVLEMVTVYFDNGKTNVDPKYTPQLLALVDKAKSTDGYLIEVKGYASSVGSVALNQQLSEDRADAVANILVQQGNVPLTRMLAPAAMGESHQVGNDQTEQGQAENRRVVVLVLQNKAVAANQ
jgi:OmpA-OmpF porin, OOP family